MYLPQSALILDSDAAWTGNLEKILKNIGFLKVVGTQAAKSALETYINDRPDLLCIDVKEPNKEGIETIKQIVSKIDSDAKIVVFSKLSDRNTVLDCINGGATHYILKGDDMVDIQERIENFIKKTRFPAPKVSGPRFVRSQRGSFL